MRKISNKKDKDALKKNLSGKSTIKDLIIAYYGDEAGNEMIKVIKKDLEEDIEKEVILKHLGEIIGKYPPNSGVFSIVADWRTWVTAGKSPD